MAIRKEMWLVLYFFLEVSQRPVSVLGTALQHGMCAWASWTVLQLDCVS
jgi:hypothetical protein